MTELDNGKKLLLILTGILVFFLLLPYFGIRVFRDSSVPSSQTLPDPQKESPEPAGSSRGYTIRSSEEVPRSKDSEPPKRERSKRKGTLEDIDSLLK